MPRPSDEAPTQPTTPPSGSDGQPVLYYRGTAWVARVGVETQNVSFPQRVSVTQTLGSARIDHFGPNIGKVQLAGSFGYGTPSGKPGEASYRALRALIQAYGKAVADSTNPDTERLIYLNPKDAINVIVVPDEGGLQLTQSRSDPMIRRWQLGLLVVRDNLTPAVERVSTQFLDGSGGLTPPAGTGDDAADAITDPVPDDVYIPPRYGGERE